MCRVVIAGRGTPSNFLGFTYFGGPMKAASHHDSTRSLVAPSPSSSPWLHRMLLALVTGIVEFAHAYNPQISVTQAAREAARTMAIKDEPSRRNSCGSRWGTGTDC